MTTINEEPLTKPIVNHGLNIEELTERRTLHLPINTKGVDYVCGDIHGRFDLVEVALNRLGFNPDTDRLIATGDMVDRGGQSYRVLEFLKKPWFHSVRGNHEQFVIDCFLYDYGCSDWINYYGGGWITHQHEYFTKELILACLNLPYIIDVETKHGLVGIAHADVITSAKDWQEVLRYIENASGIDPMTERATNTSLYGRMRFSANLDVPVKGIKDVFCGHHTTRNVRSVCNVHFIDTGAVFYGNLTVLPINQ